jgi:hypothetical protein
MWGATILFKGLEQRRIEFKVVRYILNIEITLLSFCTQTRP